MNRPIYIAVNGILNNPGNAKAWTDRFCTWINTHTDFDSEKFEYFCGILTRRFFQNQRAKNLADLIAEYKNSPAVLVGHSNGCDVICRALQRPFPTFIRSLHLISPACDADFYKNGLNAAILSGTVGRVFIYVSEKDRTMKWAELSQKLLGWLGLGYGSLGAGKPRNIWPDVVDHVIVIRYPEFDHSTIFEEEHFNGLMKTITSA